MSNDILADQNPLYITFRNWVLEFKRERSDVEDEPRSGISVPLTNSENTQFTHWSLEVFPINKVRGFLLDRFDTVDEKELSRKKNVLAQ